MEFFKLYGAGEWSSARRKKKNGMEDKRRRLQISSKSDQIRTALTKKIHMGYRRGKIR